MKNNYLFIGFACLLAGCWLAGCRPVAHSNEKNMENLLKWEKLPDLPGAPGLPNTPDAQRAPDTPVAPSGHSAENAPTAPLPPSLGVSAPFTGLHKGKLWVAGGCNFPDKPVTEGGTKRYYDAIFYLDLATPHAWKWAGKLPYPAAYGATASTPAGLICLGGNNSDSSLVRVARLSWDEATGTLQTTLLPSLPAPMDNLAATAHGHRVYVAGGNANGEPARTFLCLDLEELEKGWEKLPDFPGPARVQPVLAAQQSPDGVRIYLAGGFQPILNEEAPAVPTDLLAYHPLTRTWTKESDLPPVEIPGETTSARTLTGGCCVAQGDRYLLLAGGVNYDRFLAAIDRPRQIRQAEEAGDKTRLDSLQTEAKAYMHHPVAWYRFNTSLLRYDTFAGTWENLGEYEQLARAGAGAVCQGDTLIIVNGELKPGIRTPAVNRTSLP